MLSRQNIEPSSVPSGPPAGFPRCLDEKRHSDKFFPQVIIKKNPQVIINMGRDGRPDGSANAVFETARDAKRVVRLLPKTIITYNFYDQSRF